jgi:hypothetical protein
MASMRLNGIQQIVVLEVEELKWKSTLCNSKMFLEKAVEEKSGVLSRKCLFEHDQK